MKNCLAESVTTILIFREINPDNRNLSLLLLLMCHSSTFKISFSSSVKKIMIILNSDRFHKNETMLFMVDEILANAKLAPESIYVCKSCRY